MQPVQFYKCLADETRLRCLLLIHAEQELCVCELMAALDETQPKISRHLAQLRQHGVLVDKRQGKWVFYAINPDLPTWAHTALAETRAQNQDFIQANLIGLHKMGHRPDRQQRHCP